MSEMDTLNICYLEWNSFCDRDMPAVLRGLGQNVIKIHFEGYRMKEEEVERLLETSLGQSSCDFLFSFNYFPTVSKYCASHHVKYVSWVYDSPHIHVYSYTVLNPCNYIFLFDYAMYEELRSAGIQTVYYMPLAVNDVKLGALRNGLEQRKKYAGEISFVGSLYTEPKNRLYDKFRSISGYARGYLDGLIQAQLHVQGYNFLREMLSGDIVAEMQKAYPTNPNAESAMSPEEIYADYVLARQVTSIERREILEKLGEKHSVNLFTYDRSVCIPGVENKGAVDYDTEMPYIFMNSKISLNITLRSIKTGIPLRAFDIMGSGGFLLTNYQEELFEYFEADKDFVYYTDYGDLTEKVDYYLLHEEERVQIAQNGCRKVREQHNMRLRVRSILDIVTGERNETAAV